MISLRTLLHSAVAVATISLAVATNAQAYEFTVKTANQHGVAFDASRLPEYFNYEDSVTAKFDYDGPINFSNTQPQNANHKGDLNSDFFGSAALHDYSGSDGALGKPSYADFSTLSSFLGSSGSARDFQYGSLYRIDLGVLAKGTELTISHDDGASVYQNGIRIGATTSAPTSEVTEMVTLTKTADTILYYARENGSGSVLKVAVPEPASMVLLGTGLLAMGMVRRRAAAR